MIILCQNVLFSKPFLLCNGCFVLSTKIKKESRTSYLCTFTVWFFYQWTKFRCHIIFPSEDIKQNVLSSSSLGCSWRHMTSQTLKFIFEQLLKKWLAGRKNRGKNTKILISREQKELLKHKIKIIFHRFWIAITWYKLRIL